MNLPRFSAFLEVQVPVVRPQIGEGHNLGSGAVARIARVESPFELPDRIGLQATAAEIRKLQGVVHNPFKVQVVIRGIAPKPRGGELTAFCGALGIPHPDEQVEGFLDIRGIGRHGYADEPPVQFCELPSNGRHALGTAVLGLGGDLQAGVLVACAVLVRHDIEASDLKRVGAESRLSSRPRMRPTASRSAARLPGVRQASVPRRRKQPFRSPDLREGDRQGRRRAGLDRPRPQDAKTRLEFLQHGLYPASGCPIWCGDKDGVVAG